jgi:ABC-2 type transport system ATP-binding protein
VEQLLEMVGLTREARRRVGEYSKGMARRIGLAQALINDPDLLILDEPTTGLDPIGTREIKDLILFLNREKQKTILLCSHLLADVEDVCQRVVVLYGGRRQTMGNISDLLSQDNLTQITTDKLSDEAIARIRRIVEQEEQKHVVSVSAPTAKLEAFFLRVVREAQAARPETSGALAGGRIAGFLTESAPTEGQAVVESLIAAASKPTSQPAEAPSVAPAPQEPSREVIESLISAKPSTIVEPASPVPAAPPTEQVDRSVIDTLLRQPGSSADQGKG